MSKRIHNVIFQPGTDEANFLANEAAGMQVHCNFDLWDGMIAMMLTDEEAETLRASPKVIECGPERDVQEVVSYPSNTPRYETGSVTYRTKFSPNGGTAGADNTGLNMFFTSEFDPADGTQPFGYFQGTEYQFDDTVKSNYLGEYVDIVAIEAGAPSALYAGHEDHVDFEEWDSNNSKFIPMDWSDTSGSMTSARNNQVTNDNTNWYSAHAIGVLSAAGGKYCGWGKKSTLRVMYLADGVTTAYYCALSWHINKPVNPTTGVRNATVVTGAWGFVGVDHDKFYKIDDISQIVAYQEDGTSTTINRGDMYKPKTWNITMTASGSSAYEVTGEDRTYAGSTATTPNNNRGIIALPGDTINITNNVHSNHPIEIRTIGGTPVSGVTGAGTANLSYTLPDSTTNIRYHCTLHSSMVGSITCLKDADSWQNDYRPFVDNLIIPRVIEDPADSTDKWMISIPDQTRYSSFDTVMSQFNSYNGIYAFTSAGNNCHIGVSPTDPRFNTSIEVDSSSTYVNNTITNDRNVLTSSTQGYGVTLYPLRAENTGGDNQFTIAACQQDDVNTLMDDYSSRGPQVDFAAYGAYTWTSYPTGTYSDGKWGYFSGTSCAAPLAAGCATVFLDHYFTERGVYPSIAKLKDIMVKAAKENLIGDDDLSTELDGGLNFQNVAGSKSISTTYPAGDIASSKLYASTEVNRIKNNNYQNGGAELTELYGTPPLRVHIPWGVRMGNGKYIAGGSEQTTNGRRPTSGRTWPRQKVSFSS